MRIKMEMISFTSTQFGFFLLLFFHIFCLTWKWWIWHSAMQDRNHMSALHTDSHKSHLHVVEVQLHMPLDCPCASACASVMDKHGRRSTRISTPVRAYTCQQTHTRMWLMFQIAFPHFLGVSVEWLSDSSAVPFTTLPKIDSRLLIHFRRGGGGDGSGGGDRIFVYPFLHSHILVSRMISESTGLGPLSYQLIMGLMQMDDFLDSSAIMQTH